MITAEKLAVHVRKISRYEGITEGQAHVLRAAANEMDALTAQLQAAQAEGWNRGVIDANLTAQDGKSRDNPYRVTPTEVQS